MGMKSNFIRKRDVMEHFGYFSWIQRPKIYRNQLQNWRQFFGLLPVLSETPEKPEDKEGIKKNPILITSPLDV